MDDGTMSHRNALTDIAGKTVAYMNDGTILNITVIPNGDWVLISANHCIVPNAYMLSHGDITGNNSTLCYIHTVC
jgi:hypothetical protein